MSSALVVGGTRFLGRHTVEALLTDGYAVTICTRGVHENPFADHADVAHVRGDRASEAALERARDTADPDVVVDTCAYFPGEVRLATSVFADVDAYVYVSSGAVYAEDVVPKREDETPIEPCSEEAAVDDSHESYGARKAEGDRAVFAAAEDGVRAMSVRPTSIYGPHDYTGQFDYWLGRVREYDRVLVPGDGTFLRHLVAAENVARAILMVAEKGTAGEAYNVGDRRLLTLQEFVERVADAADVEAEVVPVNERELAAGDLSGTDFPYYAAYPHVLATEKLESLGWDPIDPETAITDTVAVANDADEPCTRGPERAGEEAVLDGLAGS